MLHQTSRDRAFARRQLRMIGRSLAIRKAGIGRLEAQEGPLCNANFQREHLSTFSILPQSG